MIKPHQNDHWERGRERERARTDQALTRTSTSRHNVLLCIIFHVAFCELAYFDPTICSTSWALAWTCDLPTFRPPFYLCKGVCLSDKIRKVRVAAIRKLIPPLVDIIENVIKESFIRSAVGPAFTCASISDRHYRFNHYTYFLYIYARFLSFFFIYSACGIFLLHWGQNAIALFILTIIDKIIILFLVNFNNYNFYLCCRDAAAYNHRFHCYE